jgi:hypothetical protein
VVKRLKVAKLTNSHGHFFQKLKYETEKKECRRAHKPLDYTSFTHALPKNFVMWWLVENFLFLHFSPIGTARQVKMI